MYTQEVKDQYKHLPETVTIDGRLFERTGKLGTDIKTGKLSVQMSDDWGFIWVDEDGRISDD